MSVWSDLISPPQQPGTQNLTFHILKNLGPSLFLHSDDKLTPDIDDTVLSPWLTPPSSVAAVYRKRIKPISMFCLNVHVRYTDFPKLYHMSLHVQYSCSIYMSHTLIFQNCITCHSMYNILVQYTCQIYWCSETVSHVNPCTIFLFNTHIRYSVVMKLYHISIHVQYSCSIYMSDILMLWNCVTYHSMYNILVQYICQIYWYCLMYHMSLNVQYSCSICMSDILMFWKCITYHSMYNILLQYRCQIYWYYETVSHVTPCIIFNGDVSRPRTTALPITMLCDNYVPYNGNIIAANNIYISCKINSCSLPH